ncbi:hypothetical protein EVAR_50000_1 [Eumeta japonica]|uniref:Uncharacterized protein n=1 Tax=Eumeta variegata TaxID=151549 RepID=A0A4C1XQ65_EUMVA|nr:hypothetical protein EVAR_50000_1 [Eumeta japonica]
MPEWKGRVPLTRSHCERITIIVKVPVDVSRHMLYTIFYRCGYLWPVSFYRSESISFGAFVPGECRKTGSPISRRCRSVYGVTGRGGRAVAQRDRSNCSAES